MSTRRAESVRMFACPSEMHRWYMPRDAEEFQAFRRAGSAPSSLCVRGARDPLASLTDICTGSLCLIAPPTDTGRDVTP